MPHLNGVRSEFLLPAAGDQVDLSLSVVLPVHNAETSLTHNVSELLDVLPEIATRFEILIVDDGSTDQTEEIAHELARCYPQVRVTRHPRRRGAAAALDTGFKATRGDVVFVHDETTPISANELRKLWSMRHDQELVAAHTESPRRFPSPHVRNRVAAWGEPMQARPAIDASGGIQMIRREAAQKLVAAGGRL